MAWTDPKTWSNGETLTAQDLNKYLRDNMLVTEAAIALTPSAWFVATGDNEIEERAWYMATVETNDIETLAGDNPASAYHDLDTVGPVVTATTGTQALVIMSVQSSSDKVSTIGDFNHIAAVACKVSGATTISALSSGTAFSNPEGNSAIQQTSNIAFFDNLNPGENTFTMQYRVFPDDNTGAYQNRTLVVLPL